MHALMKAPAEAEKDMLIFTSGNNDLLLRGHQGLWNAYTA